MPSTPANAREALLALLVEFNRLLLDEYAALLERNAEVIEACANRKQQLTTAIEDAASGCDFARRRRIPRPRKIGPESKACLPIAHSPIGKTAQPFNQAAIWSVPCSISSKVEYPGNVYTMPGAGPAPAAMRRRPGSGCDLSSRG